MQYPRPENELIHMKFSPNKVNKLVDKAVQFPAERRPISLRHTRVLFDQPSFALRALTNITTIMTAIATAAQKYG